MVWLIWVIMLPLTFPPAFFLDEESNRSNTPMRLATKERYGPTFAYDEFLAMRSKTWGFFLMMSCVVGMALMTYITPVSLSCNALLSQCSVQCIDPLGSAETHTETCKQAF